MAVWLCMCDCSATLDLFKTSLQKSLQSSPTASRSSYRAEIVVSFYDKREIKEWIGLVTRTEHVYFERWHIPIVVPLSGTSGTTGGDVDVAQAYRIAYDAVTKGIMAIIEVRSCCHIFAHSFAYRPTLIVSA